MRKTSAVKASSPQGGWVGDLYQCGHNEAIIGAGRIQYGYPRIKSQGHKNKKNYRLDPEDRVDCGPLAPVDAHAEGNAVK